MFTYIAVRFWHCDARPYDALKLISPLNNNRLSFRTDAVAEV